MRLSVDRPHVAFEHIFTAFYTLGLVKRTLYPFELVIGELFNPEDYIIRPGIGPGNGLTGYFFGNLRRFDAFETVSEKFQLTHLIQKVRLER